MPLESVSSQPRRQEQAQTDQSVFLMKAPPRRVARSTQEETVAAAVCPRLSIREMSAKFPGYSSRWATQIPSQALFYDEVDSIAGGYRERGLVVDQRI